jgi:uncharacterized protein
MYVMQTPMLFPTWLVPSASLPAASHLEVETPDGERLIGVHLAPVRERAGQVVLLGFGGNAWNVGGVAAYLHEMFPQADVVAFHYRGYRPSGGSPSAAALLADVPVVYDHVRESLGTDRIVAVGLSIGSGVAAHLAARRPLAGLILVSPFDSLEALARGHYPWVPVRWLLRHQMSTVDDVRGLTTPTALIAAERDTIVPPRRTEPVRRAIPGLVLDRTIARAGHNDLYNYPEFRAAMAEALALIEQASGDE